MKSNYLLLVISTFICSSSVNAQDVFRLEGTFTGLPDSTMIILNRMGTDFRVLETEVRLYLQNNKFNFSEHLDRPSFYQLRVRPKLDDIAKPRFSDYENMSFWAENKSMSLSGRKGEIRFSDVSGSALQDQFEEFVNLEKERKMQEKEATDSLVVLGSLLPESTRQAIIKRIRENTEVIRTKSLEFLLNHPEYYFARYELMVLNWADPKAINSFDLRSFYEQLPVDFKQDDYGKKLANLIKDDHRKQELFIGDKALPFQLPDSAGNLISLTSLPRKILLLDFWASGCLPCRKEHVNYAKVYDAYHTKGFEILSVSVDSHKDRWKRAMISDKMVWISLLDNEFKVYDQYGIQGIPSNYLIDQNGLIIGKNLRGEELANILEKITGSTLK